MSTGHYTFETDAGESGGTESSAIDWPEMVDGQPMPSGTIPQMLRSSVGAHLPIIGQDTTPAQDIVPVTRAFRRSHAVEHEEGSVIGAVRISPAPKAMADDIDPEIEMLAANLTQIQASEGMLVDIPRAVDYSQRRQRFRELADSLHEQAAETGDPRTALQADLAAERAANEKFYEATTTRYDHLFVIKVTQDDALRALADASVEEGLAAVPILKHWVESYRKKTQAEESALTAAMVTLLEKRLGTLERYMSQIEGLDAHALTSSAFSEVIADHFRSEDMQQYDEFRNLVRGAPIPGGIDDANIHDLGRVRHETDAGESFIHVGDGPGSDGAVARYRRMLCPRPFALDPGGQYVETGKRERSATIELTEWPERPPREFLKPIYEFDKEGVEITVATHFERREDEAVRKEAKQQTNALSAIAEDNAGGFMQEFFEAKESEADKFTKGLSKSDYDAFDAGIYLRVSVPAAADEADDALSDAIQDVKMTLHEDCGFEREALSFTFTDGIRTTSPTCTNDLGTNVTVRADGIARSFPYANETLREEEGARLGVHDVTREPVMLDIFNRNNGYDGGVYGMKGSGKTTTMQELAVSTKLQHMARGEDLNLVLATPLQDFESICEAFNGQHIVVGGEMGVNPLETSYISPAHLETVGKDAPWTAMLERAAAFLRSYYRERELGGWDTKQDKWMRAIKEANYQAGIDPANPESYKKESPTLNAVEDVLVDMVKHPGDYVREELSDDEETKKKWADTCREIVNQDLEGFAEDGQYAHFCKPTAVDFEENDVIYLDLQRFESDERAGGLMMQMLLSDLYEQAKTTDARTLFCIDEFHYMLRTGESRQFWKQTARHARHWELAVWTSTQEFGDLFTEAEDGGVELTDSMQTLFNQQAMQAYQYTKEMNDEWGEALDLSDRSQTFIEEAQEGDKEAGYADALLSVDGDAYPIRVEMHDALNPRSFALYQHDPTKHPEMWEYLEQYAETAGGDDPCEWSWLGLDGTATAGQGVVG